MNKLISVIILMLVYNLVYSQSDFFYDSIALKITLPDGRIVTNAYATNMKMSRNDDGSDTLITNHLCISDNLEVFDTTSQKNLIIYYHNDDLLVIESLETLDKRFFFLKLDGDGGCDEFSNKTFFTSNGYYLTLYYEGYKNGKKKLTNIDYRYIKSSNNQNILYQFFNN
jgi:hypothetical protein